MYKIELNSGEIVKGNPTKISRYRMLIKILDDVSEQLGHIPTEEEAATCPGMPKDLTQYKKYCTSYHSAVRSVERRQETRKQWRKATPEELAEMNANMAAKQEPSIPIANKPYDYHTKEEGTKMRKKQEVVTETPTTKPTETIETLIETPIKVEAPIEKTETDQSVSDLIALEGNIRTFAKEHLRWPSDIEIYELKQQGVPGWLPPRTVRRKLGYRETWAKQIFPEGLPEGFVQSHPGNRNQKTGKFAADKAKSSSKSPTPVKKPLVKTPDFAVSGVKTPQMFFTAAAEEIMGILNHAGGGSVELKLSIQLLGEESPTEMTMVLKTT